MEIEEQKEIWKKKWKKSKPSEMLDAVEKGFESDHEFDVVWRVLFETEVLQFLEEQLNDLEKRLDGMQVAIDKLKRHTHDARGNAVVTL